VDTASVTTTCQPSLGNLSTADLDHGQRRHELLGRPSSTTTSGLQLVLEEVLVDWEASAQAISFASLRLVIPRMMGLSMIFVGRRMNFMTGQILNAQTHFDIALGHKRGR